MKFKAPTILSLASVWLISIPLDANEEFQIDLDTLQQGFSLGQEIFEAYQKGDLPELAFTEEEISKLFSALNTALNGRDLSDLEDLRPAIPELLRALYTTEAGSAYADWLLQRFDYVVVAAWARSQIPVTPPQAPVSQPPTSGPGQPSAAPAIPAAQAQYITNLEVWRQRIRNRPVPPNAAKFLPELKKIFREAKVPEQLVWLAEVESTFNPQARSPVGAVGLFQFMPKTGEWMGLSLAPSDERNDPFKSATAAAKYLTYLHRQFDDWPLALAAYNYGQGNIRRLLRELDAKAFPQILERLPAETQMYVPKIFATIEVREGTPFAP
ncbi:MAG: lytic transglycosylase domain-containing protein [Puniceicoccaceae bacterium]